MAAATPADATGIAALLGQPLPGPMRLSLRSQESDALRHHAMVVRSADGRVIAHGARSVRRCWLRGRQTLIGYLHGLRRDEALAGAGRSLARGLGDLAATRADDEADHDFTAILAGNERARRILLRLPGAPAYHAIGGYRTAVLAADKHVRVAHSETTRARPELIAAIQALVDAAARDYATVAEVARNPAEWVVVADGGKPQSAARVVIPDAPPVRVAGYEPWLRALRPVVNPLLGLRGAPRLPPAGTAMRLAYLAHLACPAEPAPLRRLLGAAAQAALARGADHLVIGLGDGDPLRPLIDRLPAWRLDSVLYAVGPPAGPVRPSPEAAWL